VTDKWVFQFRGEGKKGAYDMCPALYDRKSDPACARNVAAKNKTEVEKFKKLAAKFFKDHGASDAVMAVYK